MLRSMTGYGRAQAEEGGFSLSVVVRSINHRFLDLQVRLPGGLEPLEPLLRRWVRERVARGHIELTVNSMRTDASQLHLDEGLLKAYLSAFQRLRNEFGFASEPDLVALLRVPGVVVSSAEQIAPEELERIRSALARLVEEALARLNHMRDQEGQILERDFRSRLDRLEELTKGAQQLASRVPACYQRRLEDRLRAMLGASDHVQMDPSRLAQEAAYLASRAEITEELTRLRSHLCQMRALLEQSGEVGRKLDFLLQEMGREANTLLSKVADVPEVGAEIATQAIEMKTEIEKLREQAQNIE